MMEFIPEIAREKCTLCLIGQYHQTFYTEVKHFSFRPPGLFTELFVDDFPLNPLR
jgi:hypothetical protein